MIKAYQEKEPFNNFKRIKPTTPVLEHSFSNTSYQIVSLEWTPLLDYTQTPPVEAEGVTYYIFSSTDLEANL